MYNAELTEQGEGGKIVDFNQQGGHDDDVNTLHFEAVQSLLDAADTEAQFFYINEAGAPRPWNARYGIVGAEALIEVVSKFRWSNNFKFDPYLAFMYKAIAEGTLKDWAIIVPEIDSLPTRTVGGRDLEIMRRYRRTDRPWQFSGSSTRQRDALQAISSGIDAETIDVDRKIASALDLPEYEHLKELKIATRGAFLLTFAGDSTSARFHRCQGRQPTQRSCPIRRTRRTSRHCSPTRSRWGRRPPAASHSQCAVRISLTKRSSTSSRPTDAVCMTRCACLTGLTRSPLSRPGAPEPTVGPTANKVHSRDGARVAPSVSPACHNLCLGVVGARSQPCRRAGCTEPGRNGK